MLSYTVNRRVPGSSPGRAEKPMDAIGKTAVYNLRTIHPVFDIIWWR